MVEKGRKYEINPEKDYKKVVRKELSILEKQIGVEKVRAYKKDLEKFIFQSITNTLPNYLAKLNAKGFDKDKIKGFSKKEFSNYLKTLYMGLHQLIEAKGYDNLKEVYKDVKDIHWYDVDLFLADKSNELVEEILGNGNWGKNLLKEIGNYSGKEINQMGRKKFDMFSSQSWKETIILVAKDIPNNIKGILKFFADLPSAAMLLPRYLIYRSKALEGDAQSKLKYTILSENNVVLGLINLIGPEGIEVLKKLVEQIKSGTQGAVAMAVVTIFGLLAGGAGVVKLGAKFGKMEKLESVADKVEGLSNKVDWTINTGGANLAIKPSYIRLAGKLNTAEDVVKENAKLSDKERLTKAENILGRKLIKEQKNVLLDAHNIGSERVGAGVYNYTKAELLKKVRILKNAGFIKQEREKLIKSGLVGKEEKLSEIALKLEKYGIKISPEKYNYIKMLTDEDFKKLDKLYKNGIEIGLLDMFNVIHKYSGDEIEKIITIGKYVKGLKVSDYFTDKIYYGGKISNYILKTKKQFNSINDAINEIENNFLLEHYGFIFGPASTELSKINLAWDIPKIEFLIDKGFKPNIQDKKVFEALSYLKEKDLEDIVSIGKYFNKKAIDLLIKDKYYNKGENIKFISENKEVFDNLLKDGIKLHNLDGLKDIKSINNMIESGEVKRILRNGDKKEILNLFKQKSSYLRHYILNELKNNNIDNLIFRDGEILYDFINTNFKDIFELYKIKPYLFEIRNENISKLFESIKKSNNKLVINFWNDFFSMDKNSVDMFNEAFSMNPYFADRINYIMYFLVKDGKDYKFYLNKFYEILDISLNSRYKHLVDINYGNYEINKLLEKLVYFEDIPEVKDYLIFVEHHIPSKLEGNRYWKLVLTENYSKILNADLSNIGKIAKDIMYMTEHLEDAAKG